MLTYHYDEKVMEIKEVEDNGDIEFQIQLLQPLQSYADKIKEVHNFYEDNKVYTDVLFYVYDNHEYKFIVREDYYLDFVLSLMKYQLLHSVEWKRGI